MNIKKIPLQDQLQQCRNVHSVHPEYIPAVLRTIAEYPADAYFASCPEALDELLTIVTLPDDADPEHLLYQDLAVAIQDLWLQNAQLVDRAETLMTEPLIRKFKSSQRKDGSHE